MKFFSIFQEEKKTNRTLLFYKIQLLNVQPFPNEQEIFVNIFHHIQQVHVLTKHIDDQFYLTMLTKNQSIS
jgi:hypothetical protein